MRKMTMFLLLIAAMAVSAVSAFAGAPASCNGNFNFTFDENGNGSFYCRGDGQTYVADATALQGGGITYQLPGEVGGGTLAVFEGETLSDAIVFSGSTMTFYSDCSPTDCDHDLADGALPNGFQASVFEDANGRFQFFSGGSQGVNNDYYGISDGDTVPEPATFVQLGLGGIGALLAAYRKLRK